MHVCDYAVLPAVGKSAHERAGSLAREAKPEQKSLYERSGGHETIEATLLSFHDKGSSHPELQHWFENVPDTLCYGQLRSFMMIGFGGPNPEESANLRNSCEDLGVAPLTQEHFQIMMTLFSEALKEMAVVSDVADDVLGNLGTILHGIPQH